jgi:hypothetical protein
MCTLPDIRVIKLRVRWAVHVRAHGKDGKYIENFGQKT